MIIAQESTGGVTNACEGYFLYSSTIFADIHPGEIRTVLGSCVSVCLFDQVLHFGGMNHYMLPTWNGEGLPTAKYGNIAIKKLISKMISFGSDKRNLVAKVLGGADTLGNASFDDGIGERM